MPNQLNLQGIEFIKEVSWRTAHKFMDELDKRDLSYGMITEWGANIPDDAKFVIELGEEGEKDFIATRGFLQQSKDGVFARLKKDSKEIDMPSFDNIFELINLSNNLVEIRAKE